MNLKVPIEVELVLLPSLCLVLLSTAQLSQAATLRLGLGLACVVFFPGYALTTALFPAQDDLSALQRGVFSLVLSIAIVSLVSLGLNWTPWGVRPEPILVSVGSLIALAGATAYYRRSKLPPEERFVLRLEVRVPRWRAIRSPDRILAVALTLSVLFAAGTVLYFLVNPKVSERYTEFYLLGPGGKLEGYPTEVTTAQPITVIVGTINREHEDVTYRVVKDVNGQHNDELAQIQLAHDQEWELPITFTLDQPGEAQKVSFLLYREGQDEPYRTLHLWIDVLPEGP